MGQKILIMEIGHNSLRSLALGWNCEDSDLYVLGKPVGMTPAPKFRYTFDNPLQAMAMGWNLMAPPQKEIINKHGLEEEIWIWYFTVNFETETK